MMQPTYSKYRKRDADFYSVYDKEDNYLFGGTVKDICTRLDITKSCVCKAIKENRLVRRRYKIVYGD